MINPSIIQELSEDIFNQALVIFLRNCELDLSSLDQAFLDKNVSEVASLSHKLIGTFGSMRVEKIPVLLREINEATYDSRLETETLEQVKLIYEELKIYIKANFPVETPA